MGAQFHFSHYCDQVTVVTKAVALVDIIQHWRSIVPAI